VKGLQLLSNKDCLIASRTIFVRMPSTIGDKTYSKSIELPETEVFRNLKNAKRFAMDIGMFFILKEQ
jgi:hypothetical protein